MAGCPTRSTLRTACPTPWGPRRNIRRRTGPSGQVYWEDRNLFGGAEQLRLQADVFYAPPWYQTLAEPPELLDPRSRRTHFRELPEAGPVGHAQRSFGRRPGGARKHRRGGLPRLPGRGRRRDGGSAPPFQPVVLDPGGRRRPDGHRDGRARQGRLHADRRAAFRHLRLDRQQARSDARVSRHRFRGRVSDLPRIEPRSRAGESARLDLLCARRRPALRLGRPGRARRHGGTGTGRDSRQLALLCRRRRLGARLCL